MITKPMLSGSLEKADALTFPILATPKLDGIRCLKINDQVLSRKFILIPNNHVRNLMANLPNGLDGELVVPNYNFNQIQSAIMSESGEPNFEFHIFDYVKSSINDSYINRIKDLRALNLPAFCKLVLPKSINNVQELNCYEEECLSNGFEGVMLRKPDGRYKCGRSTEKEGLLLKLKRFNDSEAEIVGFEEQMENTNQAEEDAFGKTKRSKQLSGMVGKNTLGKFIVVEKGDTPWAGKQFFIGTGEGLTEELRKTIWSKKDDYIGKIVTYKYQPHGVKDLPRLPIWKGFRDMKDIGD
jgi:DNA ligase-1